MSNPPVQVPAVMPFSLNGHIYVRLTPHGRAFHAAQHAMFNAKTGKSIPYEPILENPQGYSRWTLWEFSNVFGDQLFMGQTEPVCEMTILMELPRPGGR